VADCHKLSKQANFDVGLTKEGMKRPWISAPVLTRERESADCLWNQKTNGCFWPLAARGKGMNGQVATVFGAPQN